ncbi:MAG: biotin-dependent carboxyltransferase family protein [Actinomycetota bacterium]
MTSPHSEAMMDSQSGPSRRALRIIRPGPVALVEDGGRPGWAHVGVPQSGAADRSAWQLVNRLVGNDPDAAAVEITAGGLRIKTIGPVVLALTGAPAELRVADRVRGPYVSVAVPHDVLVEVPVPRAGLRSYLAVRGGIATTPVLGSRSTDLLSGLGAPLSAGDVLPIGDAEAGPVPPVSVVPVSEPAAEVTVRLVLGPRDDWFTPAALVALSSSRWQVSAQSNRIGIGLLGPILDRKPECEQRELLSEGAVVGAVQVPPRGGPVVFGVDHPVTGGYPVIAVVHRQDHDRLAQLVPGQWLRFTVVRV